MINVDKMYGSDMEFYQQNVCAAWANYICKHYYWYSSYLCQHYRNAKMMYSHYYEYTYNILEKKVQKGQYPFKMYTAVAYLHLKDAYQ